MRIHVTTPSPTTVSVDDDLMAILGAALVMDRPSQHADAKDQARKARTFVREAAARHGTLPSTGLSRAIQRDIFRLIADPQALAILAARDTDEAKAKADAAYLVECAEKGWQTPAQVAEKKRLKALTAKHRKEKKARANVLKFLTETSIGNSCHAER